MTDTAPSQAALALADYIKDMFGTAPWPFPSDRYRAAEKIDRFAESRLSRAEAVIALLEGETWRLVGVPWYVELCKALAAYRSDTPAPKE